MGKTRSQKAISRGLNVHEARHSVVVAEGMTHAHHEQVDISVYFLHHRYLLQSQERITMRAYSGLKVWLCTESHYIALAGPKLAM